ncbi:MAG TPA: DUF4395 domain-containing protein [Blastocatellia bacterium]|nr:DUF4395 domain-containing protein [Blastocatellia bacterium]
MPVSPTIRARLEIQGYCNLDDSLLEAIAPWVRFSPALCTLSMALGTALASPLLLWGLAVTAFIGAVTPRHPFDLLYNYLVRRVTGTPPLPPNGAPRRFACAMAAVWLVGTGIAFNGGATVAGYVLGAVLTVMASIVSVSHVCIPSMIYQSMFGRRARTA